MSSAFPLDTKILIVDDMERMRSLVREQIRSVGYSNFYEADNGEKALQVLAKNSSPTPFGLILCDWNMPVMNGLDFLKVLRSHASYRTLPFLMVTAEADRESVLAAIKAGASNYIVKPFPPAVLDQKLKIMAMI
ncbi:MAG: response regulator, partial [Betaproteobacteria bacterium]|nr:response regulator [Betaproteobacteria bacterium]